MDLCGGSEDMDKNKNKKALADAYSDTAPAAGVATFNSRSCQEALVATLSVNSDDITVGDVIPLTLRVNTLPAGE